MKIKSFITTSVCFLAFQAQLGFADFYSKIDVGGAMPMAFDATPTTPTDAQGYGGKAPQATIIYGFGLGTKLADNLRAEVAFSAFDRFKFDQTLKFKVVFNTANVVATDTKVTQNIGSNLISTTFYYDIGSFSNITPYIGASVGMAMNDAGRYIAAYPAVNAGSVSSTPTVPPNNIGVSYDIFESRKTNNLAFGLGLGFSYQMNEKYNIDLGYMYYDLGKVYSGSGYTGVENSAAGKKDSSFAWISDQSNLVTQLKVHTLKVSFRMSF